MNIKEIILLNVTVILYKHKKVLVFNIIITFINIIVY